MPATPELSVLLPYRDAEATLETAMQSVLEQTGVRFELIAVDDGSRDASARVVERARAHDARVVSAATSGVGIARALALGCTLARAPLIARMDADDVALPGRFAAQVAALRADASLAAIGTRVEAFPDHAVAEGMRRYLAWQNGLITAADHSRQLFVESPLCHPSVMLRREALDTVGGYRDGLFPEDYDLWLRLDAAGYGLAKLPEVFLHWRQAPAGATRTDARYARARFTELKAPHLARRLSAQARPLDFWGAGQAGRRLARALEPYGVRVERFLDIDPKKIGGTARNAPVVSLRALAPPGARFVAVALAARGARDQARAELAARGYREGEDFLCAC